MYRNDEPIDARLWDSERRDSPFSTVADVEDDTYCEGCDDTVYYSPEFPNGRCRCDDIAGHEIAAENAWLAQAEYDPEAEAFEAHERAMGIEPIEDTYARECSPEAWAALRATGWGA